jgi:hypothetical protein
MATGSFSHLKFDLNKSKRDNLKQGSFPKGSEVLQKLFQEKVFLFFLNNKRETP